MKPGEYFDSIILVLKILEIDHAHINNLGYQFYPATGDGEITYADQGNTSGKLTVYRLSCRESVLGNLLPTIQEITEWFHTEKAQRVIGAPEIIYNLFLINNGIEVAFDLGDRTLTFSDERADFEVVLEIKSLQTPDDLDRLSLILKNAGFEPDIIQPKAPDLGDRHA